jgi:hypothetical protein
VVSEAVSKAETMSRDRSSSVNDWYCVADNPAAAATSALMPAAPAATARDCVVVNLISMGFGGVASEAA